MNKEELYPTDEELIRKFVGREDLPLLEVAKFAVDNAVKKVVDEVLSNLCQRPINGAEICFEWALSEKFRQALKELIK